MIIGEALLTNEVWEHRHDLIFQLELNRSECEFLTGELATAAERVEMLRSRVTDAVELATATSLGIDIYLALGQIDCGIALGRDYLRHLAIDWPLHPTEEQVQSEYQRVWSQLGSRAIENVMDLPLMSDAASIVTLDVLTKLLPAALHIDVNLFALVVCRAASLASSTATTTVRASVMFGSAPLRGCGSAITKVHFDSRSSDTTWLKSAP